MDKNSKIYVAGHTGLVGSAIVRALSKSGHTDIITREHSNLDLTRQSDVESFFERERPEYVFLAAAKVGGILANNTYRAEFIHSNLAIQMNVIHTSYVFGVKKLLFLGSSCVYPRECLQPMKEESLLSGYLEPTNEPYAIAKIAGIKMCESYNRQYGTQFVCAMPTNLYGPNDNFDLKTSHALPALIRKFVEAKEDGLPYVNIWGTGKPRREFMNVDDAADAALYLVNMDYSIYRELGVSHLNVGTGKDVTISELAKLISKTVGYEGDIRYDMSKPDGMPWKLLDVSRINAIGWKTQISLDDGIKDAVHWFVANYKNKEEK
jgi:GDP-L-fucose synthase